jgi:hypothetical protein
MMRSRIVQSSLLVAVLIGTTMAQAVEPDPEFGKNFVLSIVGGPPPAEIEVYLNGEWATTIDAHSRGFHEVAELLRPGWNELKITLGATTTATPPEGRDLRIEIFAVERDARSISAMGAPLAKLTVPQGLAPAAKCTETVRFHLGPRPAPKAELKNLWYLFVEGPPGQLLVSVSVNGQAVWTGTQGNAWIDVTSELIKGKNAITFEGRSSCLVQPSGDRKPLRLEISRVKIERDTIEQLDPAQVYYDVGPERSDAFTVNRNLRAW